MENINNQFWGWIWDAMPLEFQKLHRSQHTEDRYTEFFLFSDASSGCLNLEDKSNTNNTHFLLYMFIIYCPRAVVM